MSHTSAYNNSFDTLVAVVTCLDNMSTTEENMSWMFFDVKCQVRCGDRAAVVAGNPSMLGYRCLCDRHTFTCDTYIARESAVVLTATTHSKTASQDVRLPWGTYQAKVCEGTASSYLPRAHYIYEYEIQGHSGTFMALYTSRWQYVLRYNGTNKTV